MTAPEWLSKPLAELNEEQWEALCDGCGKCCMVKLQDAETQHVYYTNVACELFNQNTCQCNDYAQRTKKVPTCLSLSLERPEEFAWLPQTCAYRLRFNSQPLYPWHPLISGDKNSVHEQGMSIQGKSVAQCEAGPLEKHIVTWFE